jgi:hypothetical protein
MTYTQLQEFAQIEKTCDEIRQENIALRMEVALYIQTLNELMKLNSLGKTKQIADRIQSILK